MIRRDSCGRMTLLLTLIAAATGGCADRGATEATDVASGQQAVKAARPATRPAATTTPAKPALRGSSSAAKSPGLPFAAGQLVVKFKSDDRAGVTDDVQTCLRQGRSFATATADGSASLDAPMKRHGVFGAASLIHGRHGLTTGAAKTRLHNHAKGMAQAKGRSRVAPVEDLVNVYRLDLPASADLDAAMQELRNDPHVEYVHPNYIAKLNYTPNDPYWSSSGSWGQPRADLWDMKLMHTDKAWDKTRGNGVVVAVVDSGLDATHPDIAGNIWTNSDEIPDNGIDDDDNGHIDDVHGWDILSDSNLIEDGLGHGTHVAGTIAAQDNNGLGIVGVAPDAKIMPIRVFAFHTETTVFILSQGLLYAAQNGADVINNSWEACGENCPTVGVVEDAVRTAHAAGTVVVFSAGNSNIDIRHLSPQNQPEAIVVSATTPSDVRADFSNFGLVDLGAPGAGDPNDAIVEPGRGILSLRAANCLVPWICSDEIDVGDAYLRLSGTSMAGPHVAGAAALVLGLHPNYSPEQVRQVLRRASLDTNANGYDPDLGYGRVDTAKIITEPTPLEALIQLPLLVKTSQVPVPGKANGDQFQKYVVEYAKGNAPTTWTTISTSTSPVTSGTLATWDASKLADGDYTFRLTAYKQDGTKYEDLHQLTLDRVAITSPLSTSIIRGGDISITGIASPGTFKSFALRVQTLETGAAVAADLALTNGGRSPVANGVLGVWHAQNVRADHYRIILDVTNADGTVTSENVVVIVDSLVHAGWPVELTFDNKYSNQPTEPIALVDLQGDGPAEILAGWGEKVSVFKGDGTILQGWPQLVTTQDNPGASLKSMPLAGDIDGDGAKDVVASNSGGTIFVWSANGVMKPGWPRTIPNEGWTQVSLTLADVDRNGVLDIVATDLQAGVHVFRGNGNYLSGWPVSLGYGIKGPATVADLNKDGKMEVIVGIDANPAQLTVLNAQGVVQTGWPKTLMTSNNGESFGSFPVVGDLDDDGDLEIAAVSSDGTDPSLSKVFIYHHNGQLLSSWSTGALTMAPIVLADLDGDGSLEILSSLVKSDNTGAFYVWDRNGNVLPGWPRNNPPNPWLFDMAYNAPIVLDLDGDGRSEIIASRQQEYALDEMQIRYGLPVQGFRYDGSTIADMARPAYGAWSSPAASPGVADTDGDGRLELVWAEIRDQGTSATMLWPRLFAWDLAALASSTQGWPMYRADARHSGIAQSVVPLVRLTQRNTVRRVNGLGRFLIHSGSSGVIQLKHAWQAPVKYAVGSDLLKSTSLGWGEQITVAPNQDIKLRIVTSSAIDVTIDWW